jgi:4-amino-4-deoxy-L-arabinose transferase-like glycosyltransferase
MMTGRTVSAAPALAVRRPILRSYAGAALAAVAVLTAARVLWLAVQPADLSPDEARYWLWAQHPALGYASAPPLLAWLIALATRLFGNSEFAVRLAAPLLLAGAAFFVYAIAARLYDARIGFWSAFAYASLPGVSASAFIISTDAPLLLLWSAALYAFVRARETGGRGWWLLVGAAVGLGLLAKYAMAYWVLSALAFVLMDRAERRHLAPLLIALGLAFAIYAPNLLWNWQHGFAGYYPPPADHADFAGPLYHPHALMQFFTAQFAVFGPLFFAVLLALPAAATRSSGRFLAEPRARLLAGFALPTLVMMLVLSFLAHAPANWAAPAYVSATVLVVRWLFESGWRRFVPLAIALHLIAALGAFAAPEAFAALGRPLPARYDVLHRLRGWRTLGREVGAVLARHPGLRLLADDRQVLAALIYYVRPHPYTAAQWKGRRLVAAQGGPIRGSANSRGDSFLLVSRHPHLGRMRPSFAAIARIGALAVPTGPGTARHYTLSLARDFKGDRR